MRTSRRSTPSEWRAEWKWDGIRVQLTAGPGGRRIWSRGGEDVSGAFPEIAEAMDFHAVLDGELLVIRENGAVGALRRPAATAEPQGGDAEDAARLPGRRAALRPAARRRRGPAPAALRRAPASPGGLDGARPPGAHGPLGARSPSPPSRNSAEIRAGARAASIEGLMLKRADSPYVAGRVKGLWWKWKRDPLSVDAVLMYAQRGHGKRAVVLQRLHLRPVASGRAGRRGAGAGRARPIPATRTRSSSGSTAGYATTPSPASARCARWRSRWCWR